MAKSKDKKIRWDLIDRDKMEEFCQVYYDEYKKQEADFQQRHTKEVWDVGIITRRATLKHSTIERLFLPEAFKPRALFLFDESLKGIVGPYFYVIKPSLNTSYYGTGMYSNIWGIRNFLWVDLESNPSNSDTFRVLLSSGEIINFESKDLGEGMAGQKEFIISNGDTSEYVRVDFETFSEKGKVIKSFIDLVISKEARIFDFKRKCWFLRADVIEPLIKGIETLIAQNSLFGYKIIDNREIIEDFEDFFHNQEGLGAAPAKTKDVLALELAQFFADAQVPIPTPLTITIACLKPCYRKAALFYHPDRNNGDGSKMAALNVIWSQLQEYIK